MTELSTAPPPSAGVEFPLPRTCPYAPPEGYARFRDTDPLVRVTLYNGTSAWLVTRLAEAQDLLTDERLSANSRSEGYPFVVARMEGMKEQPPSFIGMDAPHHTVHRRMLIPDFSVKRMRAIRPYIEQIVNGLIDRMLEKGEPVDLVKEFALPVPSIVIAELLGVPEEDDDFFVEQSSLMIQATTPGAARDAGAQLAGYVNKLISKKEQEQGDPEEQGLIGRLTLEQLADGSLARQDLVQMALLLLVAGHQTTSSMISLSVATLLQHPDQLAALKADPSGLAAAVEELLRFLSITDVSAMRVATADIPVGDQLIRAGEGVVVVSTLVNRDERAFPDPDRLDLTRDARSHMSFSHGSHQCLGQNLARLEVEVALGVLFERIPTLRLAAPMESLSVRGAGDVQGVNELPVTW